GARIRANGIAIRDNANLPAGAQLLELSAPGYLSKTIQTTVSPGATAALHESLVALEPPRNPVSTRRIAGISAASVGVVTLGTGLALFLWNDARYQGWKDTYDEISLLPDDSPGREVLERESNHQLSQIEQIDTVTWALGIGGAALT